MNKRKRTQTEKQKVDEVNLWTQSEEGRAFRNWWKNHWQSGYASKGTQERWAISPYKAWHIWRYRAEFYANHREFVPPEEFRTPDLEEIELWAREQQEADAHVADLEKRFGVGFWKRMTPLEFIQATKAVVTESMSAVDIMVERNRAEIEKAYEYQPGQSEEETALLSRRREKSV